MISFQGFRKVFGETVAVAGLDLEVAPGVICGLLGPNGSGKTTCIRAVCGLLRPTAGSVRVLDGEPRAMRSRLGYMPQQAALYQELTARENVSFFARGDADPAALLELVGLSARADDRVAGFSGGMRQRVSLACALAAEPDVLLLDEPTAGVDPRLRRRMWDSFRSMRDAGRTLLVSTNQLDEAVHCDVVAILSDGRLLALDTPAALLGRGRARVTVDRGGERTVFDLADYERELPRLLAGAAPAERVQVERDSLEDVMLRLVDAEGGS